MTEFELPLEPIPAESSSPDNLIIFSKPKIGKTSALAQIPRNLILDLDKGAKHINGIKIKINSIEDIFAAGKQIAEYYKKNGKWPYDYITVDTITVLEDLAIPYAEKLYSHKPQGKNWFKMENKVLAADSGKAQYGNILNLPNGAGYMYIREAMTSVINYIKKLAPRIILVCHVKETLLEKAGAEFTANDIDLTGKMKRIITSQSDAIGYLYRKGSNENYISFATSDTVICGARPAHLKNKTILLSKYDEKTDTLETYWNQIFID